MAIEFEERRRFPRLVSRIPMRYRKIEADNQEFKGSMIKDISQGGARMTSYEFLRLNMKLAMEIPLAAGTKPIEGTGRIAWIAKAPFSDQYDAGVEFTSLNQGDQAQLADFIWNKNFESLQ